MLVGDVLQKSGFITQAKFLRMQSSGEVERRIGYRNGRLAQGWSLLFLQDRLAATDFEFRAYSHMSGGVAQGHMANPPDRRNAEQWLKDNKYDVPRLKEGVIRDVFRYSGLERLAKVIPVAGEFGQDDYPVGSGIPQWALIKNKSFRVAAVIGPGQMYTGNYI